MKEIFNDRIAGYTFINDSFGHENAYLLPEIGKLTKSFDSKKLSVFDLGCGNGATANWFMKKGYTVSGVDPSETGIAIAKNAFPKYNLNVGSCYDQLSEVYGNFPLVINLEVVEHVYAPREFARCIE